MWQLSLWCLVMLTSILTLTSCWSCALSTNNARMWCFFPSSWKEIAMWPESKHPFGMTQASVDALCTHTHTHPHTHKLHGLTDCYILSMLQSSLCSLEISWRCEDSSIYHQSHPSVCHDGTTVHCTPARWRKQQATYNTQYTSCEHRTVMRDSDARSNIWWSSDPDCCILPWPGPADSWCRPRCFSTCSLQMKSQDFLYIIEKCGQMREDFKSQDGRLVWHEIIPPPHLPSKGLMVFATMTLMFSPLRLMLSASIAAVLLNLVNSIRLSILKYGQKTLHVSVRALHVMK